MPTTVYERLCFLQELETLPPLSQQQKAKLGRLVWKKVKPFAQEYYPLNRVQSIEPEGYYTVLEYPDALIPHIDTFIIDFYEKPAKKRVRVKIPVYSTRKQKN